jgi:hypothetical protein
MGGSEVIILKLVDREERCCILCMGMYVLTKNKLGHLLESLHSTDMYIFAKIWGVHLLEAPHTHMDF